jgi:zinc and cadmium transporter
MNPWISTLLSVLGVSAVSLVGVFALALRRKRLERLLLPLVSLSVGALFGGAVLHLIPHALHEADSELLAMGLVCGGFLGFLGLDRLIRAYQQRDGGAEGVKPYVPTNLIGDGVHNLLDGMVIAAGYLAGTSVGIAVTIAVMAHEVPHELGDFGVLVHGGLSVGQAIFWNFVSALAAVVGAVAVLLLGARANGTTMGLLPVAAGAFLYIALAQLVPELNADQRGLRASVVQIVLVAVGIGVMVAAMALENGAHIH